MKALGRHFQLGLLRREGSLTALVTALSAVRGVRMVDPRQCSVARAVIMEHYRILVSPASCRGRDTAAVGTGVSWLGNYTHAACSILVKILIKLNGHHSAIYSFR